MKTAPQFDTFLGHSHAVNTKVELRAPDDTVIGELPVEAGTVTGAATRSVARWSGDLTLAGLEWAPDSPTHPLSGLSGHYCSVQRSGYMYGGQEQWVEVARLWVYETQVEMSRRGGTLTVRLDSPAALADRAIGARMNPLPGGETCQAFIVRMLRLFIDYPFQVVNTTSDVPMPQDYIAEWDSPLRVVEDAAGIANVRVFFDATGRLIIRDLLPPIGSNAASRQVGVNLDVIRYTLSMGRDLFSNHAVARYQWEDTNGDQQERVGVAQIDTGPLDIGGPAGRMSTMMSRDGQATQAQVDQLAQAVLTVESQAWVTSRIDAVQDPRIEPDDIIETRYLDRTLRHRVVGVQFDLTTDQMQITGRTTLGST